MLALITRLVHPYSDTYHHVRVGSPSMKLNSLYLMHECIQHEDHHHVSPMITLSCDVHYVFVVIHDGRSNTCHSIGAFWKFGYSLSAIRMFDVLTGVLFAESFVLLHR